MAIKILPAALTAHADRLNRFEREARVLAALNHPAEPVRPRPIMVVLNWLEETEAAASAWEQQMNVHAARTRL